ncbi:MAG: hypothetical protein AAB941_00170 [Patescibacteria group bacterium]
MVFLSICTFKFSAPNGAFVYLVHVIVSRSKLGTSLLVPLFPTETVPVSTSHEMVAIVPLILSPSKQQNRESLISKSSHGDEEIGTLVLLLPPLIIPSIAGGNIVLCKNEGSLSAENPERINAIRTQLN